MGMSPLKTTVAAAGLATLVTGVSGAEYDVCNPESYAEGLAGKLLHTDVAEWPTDELVTLGKDGIAKVSDELLSNWNIRKRDAERVIQDIERATNRGRAVDWEDIDETIDEKVPMIEPVVDELKAKGTINAESLKEAWVKTDDVMVTYNQDATNTLQKLAASAPKLECPA